MMGYVVRQPGECRAWLAICRHEGVAVELQVYACGQQIVIG